MSGTIAAKIRERPPRGGLFLYPRSPSLPVRCPRLFGGSAVVSVVARIVRRGITASKNNEAHLPSCSFGQQVHFLFAVGLSSVRWIPASGLAR